MTEPQIQGLRQGPIARLGQLARSDIMRAAQKYVLAGGTCSLVDWGLFAFLLYVAELHYILCGAISFVLATALNYVLSVRFVFGASRRGARSAVALIYMVSTIGLGINIVILTIGVDLLGLHPMLTKILASGATLFWNFLVRYLYIFK